MTEFNVLTMNEITKGQGEKNINAVLDDNIFLDADSGDMLKVFDDILDADTAKIVRNENDSIDEKKLKEKEKFENFADLLMELEEEGENLDPIVIGSNMDKSSFLFLENGGLNTIVLGTHADKPNIPFHTHVPSRFENSTYHNFPLGMENSNEPEFTVVGCCERL